MPLAEWLIENLNPGHIVGLDPKYYGKLEWDALDTALKTSNITLSNVNYINLIDRVWMDDESNVRPECPKDQVRELDSEFSGKIVQTKLQEVYSEMDRQRVEVLIVTELDEIACKISLF